MNYWYILVLLHNVVQLHHLELEKVLFLVYNNYVCFASFSSRLNIHSYKAEMRATYVILGYYPSASCRGRELKLEQGLLASRTQQVEKIKSNEWVNLELFSLTEKSKGREGAREETFEFLLSKNQKKLDFEKSHRKVLSY